TYDYLSDLPPAVENIAINKDMLCPYTTELVDNLDSGSLEGSLLDDLINRSLLSEQEAMRTEADLMTLVYQDCLFSNEVFYAKNVGIQSKDHILSLVESEKKALCPIDTKISPELAEE
ncbi:4385_t:CDS:2, partial [Scutellospora calospora]